MGIELEIAVEDEQEEADQGREGSVKIEMKEVAYIQVTSLDLAALHGYFEPLAEGGDQLFINSATLDLEFTMEQEEIKRESPWVYWFLTNVFSQLPDFSGDILFYT